MLRRACLIAVRVGRPVEEVIALLLSDMLARGTEAELVDRFRMPSLPFLGVRR